MPAEKVVPRQTPPKQLNTPEAAKAEAALVGAMLSDPIAIALCFEKISHRDFYDSRNQIIVEAICDETENDRPVDRARLIDYLARHSKLAQAGGEAHIDSILTHPATLENIEQYVSDVRDAAIKRYSLARISEAQEKACNGVGPAEIATFLQDVGNELKELAEEGRESRKRFKLIPAPQFKHLPPPSFLIDDLIVEGSISALVGPSETYKSFVAISIAAAVSTGTPWHSREVVKGPVIYISGEGSGGIGRRMLAWENYHQLEFPENCYILPEAVQLLQDGDVTQLIAEIEQLPEKPKLIVIDTLARAMVGGDENSAQDMGVFVAAADRLRVATGGHVLIVHHFGKDNKVRGSSALMAAVDTAIEVEKAGVKLTLKCGKQKDSPHFEPIALEGVQVELSHDSKETSLVFDVSDTSVQQHNANQGIAIALKVLEANEKGLKCGEWEKNCLINGIKRRTFYNYKAELIEQGRVMMVQGVYIATGN